MRFLERTPRSVPALALLHLFLHVLTAGRYGLFRDEFYYLACADHPAWGYVDHPPLSIFLLIASRAVLGDSPLALRLPPAIAGAALVLLAAALARRLGGGRFAEVLAALCVAITPQYLGLTGIYSMNAYDLVVWAAAALLVIRLVDTNDSRVWLPLGALLGLGLLNKLSVLFLGLGLAVAILLTPLRRHLRRPHPWLGGLLAAAVFAPHVAWQMTHGWPTVEFIRNATAQKIAPLTPLQFLLAQVPEIHPFNAPVWILGLGALLVGRLQRYRALGIVYLTVLVVMAVQRSKPYYLGPSYSMLLAAGAVSLEGLLAARRAVAWGRPALLSALGVGGVLTAPFAVPVLPVGAFIAYSRALGEKPGTDENHEVGPLPQFFADRFGWREMAQAVAGVYDGLPEPDKADVIIVTANYGEAGAIGYYGRGLGLPAPVSQHNSFFLWGPGRQSGNVAIAVGIPEEGLRRAYESVSEAARLESPYAMPYETREPIFVCRGLKLPLGEAWRRGKHFI